MPFPPKKKPKADIALLLGEPADEEPEASDEMPEEEDDLGLEEELPDEEEPLAADGEDPFGDEAAPSIDPEQAALAETLGFTDPEQQQALIDLIKLVNAPPSDMGGMGDTALPLPESTY